MNIIAEVIEDNSNSQGSQPKYEVEKIVNDKTENGRKFYRIKWVGYDKSQNTWEPAEAIIEDIPDMVKEYEK